LLLNLLLLFLYLLLVLLHLRFGSSQASLNVLRSLEVRAVESERFPSGSCFVESSNRRWRPGPGMSTQ
jgi:hypothetical protein